MKKSITSNNKAESKKSELSRELILKVLHSEMIDFIKKYNEIDKMQNLPVEVNDLMESHFSNVASIMRKFMTSSFKTKTGRPKNQDIREYFRNEVILFQIKNSGSKQFPTEKAFFKQLDQLNAELHKEKQRPIVIDSKTFTNFKKEWREGLF